MFTKASKTSGLIILQRMISSGMTTNIKVDDRAALYLGRPFSFYIYNKIGIFTLLDCVKKIHHIMFGAGGCPVFLGAV